MKSAFIFPGQGSQKIGMASAFMNGYKAGFDTMKEIEEAISFNLSDLIENGTMKELTRAENAQPAIFAVSMMCVNILKKEYGYNFEQNCKYLAGHSLGEYSALCVSGVFSLSDTAKIVRKRGELMSEAFPNSDDYAMVALLGVCASDIDRLIMGVADCFIANDNSNNQVVISGKKEAVLKFAEDLKSDIGLKKAVQLKTSGPFHSPLMADIAVQFDKYVSGIYKPNKCKIPVIMNITAKPTCAKDNVIWNMTNQITSQVKWRETTDLLVNDKEIGKIVEIAPGQVLSNMITRAYPEADVLSLDSVHKIADFVKSYEEI